jgi:hypothetical protein
MKNVRTQIVVTVLAGLSALITSCGPALYSNVGQNVPMFTEKGQANLSVGLGLTSSLDSYIFGTGAAGLQLSGAIAAGDRIAVLSSGYFLTGSDGYWDWNTAYAEAGIGTFGKSEGSKFVWEVFVGTGLGTINNSEIEGAEFVDVRYIKPFVQPSFGFKSKVVELAFTPRIGLVSYTSYGSNAYGYIYDEDYEYEIPFEQLISERKSNLAFEPGFTFRVGKKVKFQYQLNISTVGVGGHYEGYAQNVYMSYGVMFSTSDFIRKK